MDSRYIALLAYWITERETIRQLRWSGAPPPWTTDGIMADNHFCNVQRESDRGTVELKAVFGEVKPDLDDMPAFWTVARLFNSPLTTRIYWDHGIPGVRKLQDGGQTVFNTAYVVSTCGVSMDKVDYVHRVVHDVKDIHVRRESCREAFNSLRTIDGLGSFLSGQIVADLKYTPYLQEAPDFNSFAVMGPGSKKGLDFIFGGGTTETNFMARLMSLRAELGDVVGDIHNQDLQNCLCEFSKYIRYRENLPGRRRPYHVHN